MDHDPYVVDYHMTPIEENIWQSIRSNCMPFYYQFPVLNYFVDFGCPFKKIAIECDGKDWHDPKKDEIRDAELIAAGWTIYRIKGKECNDLAKPPFVLNEIDKPYDDRYVERWFMETGEGICWAINEEHFRDSHSKFSIKNWDYIQLTLDKHISKIKY
jgi:very-short-patch-repair endonuclease